MTDWAHLRHAYGPADDVPALLAAAEESGSGFSPAWNNAWGSLCHQGTVYSGSYAALPLLLAIAERRGARGGYDAALGLAAGIIASSDGPRDSSDVRAEYEVTLESLRDLAARNLAHADGDSEFVFGLEALLAFEDGGVWQRALSHLIDEEVPLICSNCDSLLVLDTSCAAPVVCFEDEPTKGREVEPATPSPDTVEHRLMTMAVDHERVEVARTMRFLFGSTFCPKCRAHLDVADSIRAYFG